jgi:hypothetical protein
MKLAGLVLLLVFAAVPASAGRIRAWDADAHVGETATVEGRLHVDRMASGEIYLDLDGASDGAPLSGYISRWNANRFPGLAALDGKLVDITGEITTFRYRPEIFITDPGQIAAR